MKSKSVFLGFCLLDVLHSHGEGGKGLRPNVRGERKIRWLGLPLTLYGEGMNITNHRNLQGYIYSGHYSERVPFYMIPRLPFFGLEASW